MELTKNTRRSRILLGEPRSSSFQRVAARLIDFTFHWNGNLASIRMACGRLLCLHTRFSR